MVLFWNKTVNLTALFQSNDKVHTAPQVYLHFENEIINIFGHVWRYVSLCEPEQTSRRLMDTRTEYRKWHTCKACASTAINYLVGCPQRHMAHAFICTIAIANTINTIERIDVRCWKRRGGEVGTGWAQGECERQPQNECERLRHFLRMNEIVSRANAFEVQFDAENNGIVS